MPRQHDQLLELRSNPKGEHEGEDPPKEVGSWLWDYDYDTSESLSAFVSAFFWPTEDVSDMCSHDYVYDHRMIMTEAGSIWSHGELCPWQAEVKVTIEARLVAQRSNTSK